MKIYYRYDMWYRNEDDVEWLICREFHIVKETEKWYWISNQTVYVPGHKYKWIPKKDNFDKQFARDTKEKAMKHLIRRLLHRIRWYWFRMEECKIWMAIANGLLENIPDKKILYESDIPFNV